MSQAKRVSISLLLLTLLPCYASAQLHSSAPAVPAAPSSSLAAARVIEVAGNGQIQAAPDLATLEIAIETHAPTADRAAGLNGTLAEKVHDALESKLGDKGTMWTGGYSLYPEYSDVREPKPTVSGYRAENSITVETGELGLVGPLIDAAIGAGANRINSLNYSLRADTKVRSQAIAKAAHDAQMQASALAEALGVKLGPVIKASTESQVRVVPLTRFATSAAMAARPPTPIAAGQVTVPATVSLTYSIE